MTRPRPVFRSRTVAVRFVSTLERQLATRAAVHLCRRWSYGVTHVLISHLPSTTIKPWSCLRFPTIISLGG